MKYKNEFIFACAAFNFLMLFQGWQNYSDIKKEAIQKGFAEVREGEFRWKNIHMKNYYD